MSDFVTQLVQALKSNRYVVLGDPHHGSASLESIVEAVAHEAGHNQVALISVLQDTEILLENLRVGQQIAAQGHQRQHRGSPETQDRRDRLRNGEKPVGRRAAGRCREPKGYSEEPGAGAATRDRRQFGMGKPGEGEHEEARGRLLRQPPTFRNAIVAAWSWTSGFVPRLKQHGSAVGYAVVPKNDKTDQTYIPEKQPQPADDMFDPVAILEPLRSRSGRRQRR